MSVPLPGSTNEGLETAPPPLLMATSLPIRPLLYGNASDLFDSTATAGKPPALQGF